MVVDARMIELPNIYGTDKRGEFGHRSRILRNVSGMIRGFDVRVHALVLSEMADLLEERA
jgi:3-dehydroquinate dehydratase